MIPFLGQSLLPSPDITYDTKEAYFIFGCTWDWTQSLALARQVLYHLSYAPSLFCFWLLFDSGSHMYAQVHLDSNPPITYASHIAEVTGACCHDQYFISWDGFLITFCLGWPWTMVLLGSVSNHLTFVFLILWRVSKGSLPWITLPVSLPLRYRQSLHYKYFHPHREFSNYLLISTHLN
jgi:hypothetical protein